LSKCEAFDKEWKVAGHTDKAVALLTDWVKAQNVPGLELEVWIFLKL
jgi:hypothetical protein